MAHERRLIFSAIFIVGIASCVQQTASAQAPLPITITETGVVTAYSNPNLPKGTPSPVTIGEPFSITTVIDPTTIAPLSCSTPCYGGAAAQTTTTITLGGASYSQTTSGVSITLGASSGVGYAGIQINAGSTSAISSATSPVPDPLAYVNQVIAYSSNVTGTFSTNNNTWPVSVPILYGATLRGNVQTLSIQATRTITVFTTSCGDNLCNLTPYSESATITFPYTVPLDGSTFYGPAKISISIEGAQATAVIPGYNAFAYQATTLLNGVMTHDLQLVAPASVGLINVAGGYPTGIPLEPQPGLNSADFILATTGQYHFFETFGTYAKPTGFDVETVVFTLAPVAALPTVTILDPLPIDTYPTGPVYPGLLNGATITPTKIALAAQGAARTVTTIAADGIAQVVFEVPALHQGDQVTARLFSDQCSNTSSCSPSASSDDNGGFFLLGTPVTSSLQLANTETDVADANTVSAFLGYRAPVEFVRSSLGLQDRNVLSRTVFIDLTYVAGGVSYGHQTIALTVTRPPVFLIHGFNTDATAWDLFTFSAGFSSSHKIYSLNYGDKLYDATYDLEGFPTYFPTTNIDIASSTPPTDRVDVYKFARQSHLGIDFNARAIATSMQTRMHKFVMGDNPLGQPVAAIGADVLAHSMGGLIVRMLTTYPAYRSNYNFQQGLLHKLVTLGTPHWGSPQAILSLLPQSSCSRSFASSVGSLAFSTVTLAGSNQTLPGAAGDLQGDGLGISNLSQALTTINLSKVFVPIAAIAGDAESLDPMLDNRTNGAFVVRNGCPSSDPLAERHTSALFDTIFDPNSFSQISMSGSSIPTRNDGSVPLTSALLSTTISTCNPPNCFSGYTHSVGISQLFSFLGVPYLQDGSQEIVTYVETLLNTSTNNQAFSK